MRNPFKRHYRATPEKYLKFFVEGDDRPGMTELQKLVAHKSNLIQNLDMMGRGDRRKAAKEVVDAELRIVEIVLEKDAVHASITMGSALNCRRHCRGYKPSIENPWIRFAWDSENPLLLLPPPPERRRTRQEILDADFKTVEITREDMKSQVLPIDDVRINMGLFYTKSEWEAKRKEILKKKLP